MILEKLLKKSNKSPDEQDRIIFEGAGYYRQPPTIDEFLDSKEYLGHIGPTVYPFWRKELRKLHPSPYYSPYKEWMISGSIGGGKSTACELSILYDVCCFLCRRHPNEAFGFADGEPLYIALMNATQKMSEDTQVQKIINMMDDSPFFQEQKMLHRQEKLLLGKKYSKKGIALNLPHNIEIICGSRAQDALGKACISGMISELNIQTRQGGKQSVNTYVELKNRMLTRFNREGDLAYPGKLYLDSSKKDVQGVLEQYFIKFKDDPTILKTEASFWEYVKDTPKDPYRDDPRSFLVFKGSKKRDPFILQGDKSDADIPDSELLKVPEKFRVNFETDCINALRDLGGVATESTGSFLTMETITACMVLKNPIYTEKPIIYLDMIDKSDTLLTYVNIDALVKGVEYFVHIDFGLSDDRTGIAFTRAIGRTNIERFDRSEGSNKFTQDNLYQTDLVLCLKNKPDQQVPIYKVEDFITLLAKEHQIKFNKVTFDRFASADIMVRLKASGFVTEIVSVDTTRQPYDTLRHTMLERRIKMPYNVILEKELKELIDKPDAKPAINHPDKSIVLGSTEETKPSKDIADAVAGSLWSCTNGSQDVKSIIALEEFIKRLDKPKKPITINERLDQLRKGHVRGDRRF